MDLISREKLRNDIAVLLERNNKLIDEWLANCIDDVIDEQPTIEAEPVKHGRWIYTEYETGHAELQCSECGEGVYNKTKFCPNCGAKMDLDEVAENVAD